MTYFAIKISTETSVFSTDITKYCRQRLNWNDYDASLLTKLILCK